MQENPVPLSKEAQKALHEEEIKRRRLEVEILRASVEPVAAALRAQKSAFCNEIARRIEDGYKPV